MRAVANILLIAVLCVRPAAGRDSAGDNAAEFLLIEPGGRASAMGGAGTALGDDAFSVFFNPALSGHFRGVELAFERNEWFGGMERNFVAGLLESRRFGVFGASVNWLSYGNLRRTTIASGQAGVSTGTFEADDLAVSGSWAKLFGEKVSVGGAVKFVRIRIDNRSDDVFAFDAGVAYRPLPHWTLGLSLQNAGGALRLAGAEGSLPLVIRGGTSISLWQDRVLLSVDALHQRNRELEFALGAEAALGGMARVRVGYNSLSADAGDGISAGLGFQHRGMKIDYSYAPFSDLQDAHRVSLQYRFDAEAGL